MSAAMPDLASSCFHPLRDNILIRRRLTETATAAGLLIPDTARLPLDLGSVVAVGPGSRTPDGTLIPLSVAPGDEVALEHDSGVDVTVAGERFVVVSERDVLGIFTAPRGERSSMHVEGDIAEATSEPERDLSQTALAESLETDVAPDLLDREPMTGEDLH